MASSAHQSSVDTHRETRPVHHVVISTLYGLFLMGFGFLWAWTVGLPIITEPPSSGIPMVERPAVPPAINWNPLQNQHLCEGGMWLFFGLTLSIWGMLVVVSTHRGWSRAGGWLSFASLLLGVICAYPPWRAISLPAYAVFALMCWMFRAKPKLVFGTFFALVTLGMTVGVIFPEIGPRIGLAPFASIVAFSHLAVLMPDRFLRENVSGSPSAKNKAP